MRFPKGETSHAIDIKERLEHSFAVSVVCPEASGFHLLKSILFQITPVSEIKYRCDAYPRFIPI